MTHNAVWNEGYRAGYEGTPAFRNPYLGGAYRGLWFAGFTEGTQARRIDLRDGRHHDLLERAEFGFENGLRRGVAGGAKGR